jgi:hypothetical protein
MYLTHLFYVFYLTYPFYFTHFIYDTAPLIDAFHYFQALGPQNGGYVTPWSYLCVTCLSSMCLSYHVYYWPTFSASTKLTLDLAIILILSSYVPLCPMSLTFLFCTDILMCTFHSYL